MLEWFRQLTRRRHQIYHYRGLGGPYSPGYYYCRVCEQRNPLADEECPGPEAGKAARAAKAEWWAHWEEHLAAGDLPPE